VRGVVSYVLTKVTWNKALGFFDDWCNYDAPRLQRKSIRKKNIDHPCSESGRRSLRFGLTRLQNTLP
jgi:hypothetical protein